MLDWLKDTLGLGSPAARAVTEADTARRSGNWERAVELLRPIAEQRPDDAGVLYRLGDALYQLNRAGEALPWLERAARLDGNNAEYQYKLGNALKDLGRPEAAVECYRRALQLEPRHARALNNIGTILELQGRTEEALECYRRALQADAGLLPACSNLAMLLHRLERFAEAAEAYEHTLRIEPDSIANLCNLGNAYQGLGRYEDAVRCYERALALDPASADAHHHSSIALLNLEKFRPAEAAARRAAELVPHRAQYWANLGDALLAQDRLDEALGAYEHGLALNSELPEMLNNIGVVHRHTGQLETALRYFERAAEVAPSYTLARVNLGTARCALGLVGEAIAGFRETLAREPRNVHAARHLLMALLYLPMGTDKLFEEHLDFARRFAPGGNVSPLPRRKPRPDGKIRVGYVSSDLRRHPVGYNLLPIIRAHDRSRFDICFYSNTRQADSMTRWFRGHADAWRPISLLSDEAAAQLIRRDEVDILVLLAGRFDDNRPLLAQHRAAPVQVSMHDPATSGLREMDYLIADRGLSPRHAPEKFTERVACLPTFYVHAPMNDVQVFPEPPSARSGAITFGSFNNPAKVNEDVVALWARVLHAVPGSRLLLKYMDVFAIPGVRSRYAGLFRQRGIEEERLVMPEQPREKRERHLAQYSRIDIALDTFPFSGSTTTFEALWMGVPVVTLQGDRMAGRWSAAMLRKVGLARLIAASEADFVEIARTLAADRGELARLRTELRERVARSPLCAGEARARQLERLYRRMWATWLNQRS